jgi:hypothetical protein
VDGPPLPRGTTWSTSSRTSEPQTPPEASGHWHLPSSRFTTSCFTFAGTLARRFPWWAMSSSSAAVSTCSSVAPGRTWDWPALAIFSSARNSGETVMCIRVSVAVIGCTTVLGCTATGIPRSGWVRSRPTGWTMAGASTGADSIGARSGTSVTIVLRATCSIGRSLATSCFASWRERPKNMGNTSARFSSVITLASSLTVVMQSLPSRIGFSTSGKRRIIRAPTCR